MVLNMLKKILMDKGFNKKLIQLVCNACMAHRCKDYKQKSLEGKILAMADAMSHFSKGFYLRIFQNFCKEIDYEKAKEKMIKKIERDYKEKLFFKEAKEIIKPFYNARRTIKKIFLLKNSNYIK
jgi:tellurite resistance protein